MLNTTSLSDLTDITKRVFIQTQESMQPEMVTSGIVKVEDIGNGQGDSKIYTDIDIEEYASIKAEGDDATNAKVQQGYSKTMQPIRIAKDISITVEMRKRNMYSDVISRLTNLAELAPKRQDLDLQHRFGFGTATSYTDKDGNTISTTTGDGLALFSTAHTLTGSSTTYRNRLAGNASLSRGAIEGMEKLIVEETYNNLGEKTTVNYDILWTTDDPNTINTAREYLQSTAEISAVNSGVINVYKGKYKHVQLSRVATTAAGAPDTTKRRYWGLCSSSRSSFYLGIWERPYLLSPTDVQSGQDFSSENWTYGVRASYGIVVVDGRFVKFSSGDGTA